MTNAGSEQTQGNSGVITQIVTMTLKPEYDEDFIDLARRVVEKVHENEPGTLLYFLTRHSSEPRTYIWLERYRDEAALQTHGQAPYMKETMERVQDPTWWAKPIELVSVKQVVPA